MTLNPPFYLGVEEKKNSKYQDALILHTSNQTNHLVHWNISFDGGYHIQLQDCDYNFQYIEDSKMIILKKTNNSSKNQKFYIKMFDFFGNGFYYINSPEKLYITFSNEENDEIYLCSKNEIKYQIFYIVFDDNDGCYSFININNQKCLSVDENKKIKQADYYNLDSQKWIIIKNKCKLHSIFPKSNNSLILCNSISLKDPKLALKDLNSILTYNHNFNFQSINDSIYKKVKSTFGFINQSLKNIINDINKKIEFRYKHTIFKSDIFDRANGTIIKQLLENNFILKHLEIPLDIGTIDENALKNCLHIKTIECEPKWLQLLPNPINVENIIIPDNVKSIENNSFNSFYNLKFLSLPESLKFENCKSSHFNEIYGLEIFVGDPRFLNFIQKDELKILKIPSYVEEIPESICAGCKALAEVDIEDSEEKKSRLKSIGPKAFFGCKLLGYISIPESVTNISTDAFLDCKPDIEIKLQNKNQEMSIEKELVIKSDVIKITDDYKAYINITSIDIPLEVQECAPLVLDSFGKLKTVKCDPKWINSFNTRLIENVSIPNGITELKKKRFFKFRKFKIN